MKLCKPVKNWCAVPINAGCDFSLSKGDVPQGVSKNIFNDQSVGLLHIKLKVFVNKIQCSKFNVKSKSVFPNTLYIFWSRVDLTKFT